LTGTNRNSLIARSTRLCAIRGPFSPVHRRSAGAADRRHVGLSATSRRTTKEGRQIPNRQTRDIDLQLGETTTSRRRPLGTEAKILLVNSFNVRGAETVFICGFLTQLGGLDYRESVRLQDTPAIGQSPSAVKRRKNIHWCGTDGFPAPTSMNIVGKARCGRFGEPSKATASMQPL